MEHARLRRIAQALHEQLYVSVCDWNARGRPANRTKAIRKLGALSDAAFRAAPRPSAPAYEGPIERGVDPDPR